MINYYLFYASNVDTHSRSHEKLKLENETSINEKHFLLLSNKSPEKGKKMGHCISFSDNMKSKMIWNDRWRNGFIYELMY